MQSYRRMLALDSTMNLKLHAIGVQVEGVFFDESQIQEDNFDDPEELFKRASQLRRKGNFSEALEQINCAIELVPDQPFYLCHRSLIHTKMGNDRLAREDVIRAASLFSQYSSIKETTNHQLLWRAT